MALPSSRSQAHSDVNEPIISHSVKSKAVEEDVSCYLPLYKAIIAHDWKAAERFFELDRNALTARISMLGDTPLHVAATGRTIDFIEKLVELMTPEELAIINQDGDTAFHRIAGVGNVVIAKLLFKKNPDLPNMWNRLGQLPLHHAAKWGQNHMVRYLLKITKEDIEPRPYEGYSGSVLMGELITNGLYDVALLVLRRHPNLAVSYGSYPSPLRLIAQQPSAFPSGARFTFWQRFITFWQGFISRNVLSSNICDGEDVDSSPESPKGSVEVRSWFPWFQISDFISGLWEVINSLLGIEQIRELKLMHCQTLEIVTILCTEIVKLDSREALSTLLDPFLDAARLGIHEVVMDILIAFPDVSLYNDREGRTALGLAVMNRHANVYNLIYQTRHGTRQWLTIQKDRGNNTLLHLAGELAPRHRLDLVSGPALQMQRELHWYKEVEKLVPPSCKELKNAEGKTPAMVFTEAHGELKKEGERWLKDSAGSCSVAAGLIATVLFAAVITVPGDYRDNGKPNFAGISGFQAFGAIEALALSSSLTSLLMFLSVFTSRYSESDFLRALPRRFLIGLFTLFISIIFLMTAFSKALELVFGQTQTWKVACVPVALFVCMQLSLLMDICTSTYGPGIFRKQGGHILV
ncbi:uncharacterized protein LOC131331873 [Rhododendron vialii]|uniref:uncharacterized protein LOC131331873 n=1 Tax=Rhododendron vialii TaxID=182163 RepID=UPI00265E6D05|nr:uncharacterized protein LOC131331873 [Rhododendron vialii]XP_058221799.1 uncharacterized protein LOC131331873 [Rhododendron vialii]XP_058221801.1 uncharacterized protein LOC131331873 [Rhododendron vialii]